MIKYKIRSRADRQGNVTYTIRERVKVPILNIYYWKDTQYSSYNWDTMYSKLEELIGNN